MQELALPAGSTGHKANLLNSDLSMFGKECRVTAMALAKQHMSLLVSYSLMHCRVRDVVALSPCLISSDQCYSWSTHAVPVWSTLQGPYLSYCVLSPKPILHSVRK